LTRLPHRLRERIECDDKKITLNAAKSKAIESRRRAVK
jgi:hypothetical protein